MDEKQKKRAEGAICAKPDIQEKTDLCQTIEYLGPMGKSDHVVLEVELQNLKVFIRKQFILHVETTFY